MELVLRILSWTAGIVLGLYIFRKIRNQQITYEQNPTTAEAVREALYRVGLVKSEVTDAMVEFKKAGIIFFQKMD